MRFEPITEEQAQELQKPAYLLKPGECDFEVTAAAPHIKRKDDGSSSESIKLTLDVWDADGKKANVFDYLNPGFAHKFRHAAYSCGLGHVYEAGEIEAEQFLGKGGRLLIRNTKDAGYAAKNEVADYVVAERTKETPNYNKAKAADNGTKPRESSARSSAWKSFSTKTTDSDGTGRSVLWFEALRQFFGHTDQSKLSDEHWKKFDAAIRKDWSNETNGFPLAMRKAEPVMSPIGDDAPPEFKEDDIPF